LVQQFEERTKMLLLAPIIIDENRDLKTVLQVLTQQGYARIQYNETVFRIDDFPFDDFTGNTFNLVVTKLK